MKVYMVRHGESTANRLGVFSGWSQVPLTDEGLREAKKLTHRFRNLHFDKIYSSDLLRAIQTAQAAVPGCIPIQDSRLREINTGSLTGYFPAELGEKYGDSFWQNRKNRDYTAYGGESTADQQRRIASFLEDLSKTGDEKVLVFCHEGSIKCTLSTVFQTDVRTSVSLLGNCSVSIFSIGTSEPWKLIRWNDTGKTEQY
jgi:broad specificity phosphatase PhoE